MKRMGIVLACIYAVAAFAAWESEVYQTSGTNEVTIVGAPGSGTNRLIAANGGIKVYNADTNSATFTLQVQAGGINYPLDKVTLQSGETYYSDWVLVLGKTDWSLEIFREAAAGANELNIFTHYREEER